MAFSQSFEEEFLTCAICKEIYSDPCSLKCQHSFCRKCVTGYIKSRPGCVESDVIPCAFCRQVTEVPDPRKPVEEWARQIKPSLILEGLMDRHRRGYKHREGHCACFFCDKIGVPGSSVCMCCAAALCFPSSRTELINKRFDSRKTKRK